MPCCPMQPGNSAQCGAASVSCCVLHHGGSRVSAIVLASDQPRPKRAQAILTTALAEGAITATDLPFVERDSGPPYVKPVNQKKTDLRI